VAAMRETEFFREQTKREITESVQAVELQTSAEVVVTVRRRSGDYRVVAYHFGFVTLGVVVIYLLFAPEVFSLGAIALLERRCTGSSLDAQLHT
jgi:putative membrane protein